MHFNNKNTNIFMLDRYKDIQEKKGEKKTHIQG
jgi:hypothetical protein